MAGRLGSPMLGRTGKMECDERMNLQHSMRLAAVRYVYATGERDPVPSRDF